jgi:hypothetical protein
VRPGRARRDRIRPPSPGPNADLDDRADRPRVLLDGRQHGARAHAAFEARGDALGARHPVGDILLRHARRGAGGDKVGDEHLQRVIRFERSPAPRPPPSSRHELLDVACKDAIRLVHWRALVPG